jgi:hypothetical protein
MVWLVIAVVAVGAYMLTQSSGVGSGGASSSDPATAIAYAIGVAEGGYDASGNNLNNGTVPSRNHNPGDLTVDVNGTGSGNSGNFVVYSSDALGYAALVYQVNEWLNGTSANAGPNSTISDISQFYTTTDQGSWAANVASVLGVSVDTEISAIGSSNAAPQTPAQTTDQTQVASSDSGTISPTFSDDSGDGGSDTSDDFMSV